MKKRWIVLFGIMLCTSLFSLAGCKFASSQKGEDKKDEVLIADFETYDELVSMRYLNNFGAVKLSDEHVTHGEQSLYVTAMGTASKTAKPAICIETRTNYLEKYDFTDVKSFTLDVYNPSDEATNVYFQYLTADTSNKKSSEIKATVPAKTAQTVEFSIDREILNYFLNLNDVLQLRILFDPIESVDDEYKELYIDNLRAKITEEKAEAKNPRQEDEIESADRPEYLAAWGNILNYVYSPSSLEYNADKDFVKSGEGSFKITSERATEGSKAQYAIGAKLTKNNLVDLSGYASVSFWVYNANDKEITFWINANYYITSLKPNAWTYVEVSKAQIEESGREVSNVKAFELLWLVPEDKNYTFYFDEFVAHKDGLTPEIEVAEITETYAEKGVMVTIPEASVKYADMYKAEVYFNGELVSSDGKTFLAENYGEYEIVYTASARRENIRGEHNVAEKRITLYVGLRPKFNFVPKSIYAERDKPLTITPATSDEGTVTWETYLVDIGYNFTSSGKLRTDLTNADYEGGAGKVKSPTSVTPILDTAIKVVYTVTNEKGLTSSAEQYIVCFDNLKLLSEYYDQFYTGGTLTGDLALATDTQYLLDDTGGLHLTSEKKTATGTFTPKDILLGGKNSNLRYVVYNNADTAVSITVNGEGTTKIEPKSYMVFNGIRYGYAACLQGWKIVSADKELLPLTFKATGENGVDVYIGRFAINENSFLPSVTTNFEELYTIDTPVDVSAGISGAETYTWKLYCDDSLVANGTHENVGAYSFTQKGNYRIEYVVSYLEGKHVKSYEIFDGFEVVSKILTFTFVPESIRATVGERVTITPATSSDGEVTWIAELMDVGYDYKTAGLVLTDVTNDQYTKGVHKTQNPTSVTMLVNTAVRVTYTVRDSEGSESKAEQYIVCYSETLVLSSVYPTLYEDAAISGNLSKTSGEYLLGDIGGLRLSSDKTSASGVFNANVFLGENNTSLRYVVFNAGTHTVTVSVNDNSACKIAPGGYHVFSGGRFGYAAALQGWKLISTDKKLLPLTFKAVSDGAIDVHIGNFTLNATSFPEETATATLQNCQRTFQEQISCAYVRKKIIL